MTSDLAQNYVPRIDSHFVPNGNFDTLSKILNSRLFYPVLLTGPTGLGKTKMVEQIHASIKKPMIRVNISVETDEDSLMGGFRLQNGNTYFAKGPVITAMEMGATLLLDELDLGLPTRLMCLQSVLEKGGGYLIKKTGEYVIPAPGFSVVATANTKGIGDDTGTYVGTQVLNAAMLDRFPAVLDCHYPDKETEVSILQRLVADFDVSDQKKYLDKNRLSILVEWANSTRNTADNTVSLDYSISTRRLCDIVETYRIFNDLDKAIELCITRFDQQHQEAFMEYYKTILNNGGKAPPRPDMGSPHIF